MRFLITGGNGFIGRRLIQRLLERQHYVSILTRKVVSREDRNVGQYYWAMRGPAPAEPFDDVDVVIHLAGEPISQRWTDEVKKKIRESRVLGTRHLIEGIGSLARRPSMLICGSAIGIYGDRGDEVLIEESSPGQDFLAQVCADWEREADRAQGLGLSVVKIRTGIVLGQEGGALKSMLPAFKLGLGGPVGNGKQWMSWIHRDDLVNMMIHAAESGMDGVLNGVSPNPISNEDFSKTLARQLHRPAWVRVPESLLKMMLGEMSQVVLSSQRVLPQAIGQTNYRFEYPELEGALRSLKL